MKYLKQYEEINLRSIKSPSQIAKGIRGLFGKKDKNENEEIKKFTLEELQNFKHKYIESWEKGEGDDIFCNLSQSLINDIPTRDGLKPSDKIEKLWIYFIGGVKYHSNEIIINAVLKDDDYQEFQRYQYQVFKKGNARYNIPDKYSDRWKLELFTHNLGLSIYSEQVERKFDILSRFFDELPSNLGHKDSSININWPIRYSLSLTKEQKRAKVLTDNYDEIVSFFTDLSDLSTEEHFMGGSGKGSIVANFTIPDISVKKNDPYKKGDSVDSFRLNKTMVSVMDMLLEIESRVSDLLPDANFDIHFSTNKVTVFIS